MSSPTTLNKWHEIRHSDATGSTGMFATRDIPARVVFLFDAPGEPRIGGCQSCAKTDEETAPCPNCQCAWYCSSQCQSADARRHAKECAALRPFLAATASVSDPTLKNTYLSAWVTATREGLRGTKKSARIVSGNFSDVRTEADGGVELLYKLLPPPSKTLYNQNDFRTLLRVFCTNTFSSPSGRYPIFHHLISRFNHSCTPNAVSHGNGLIASLRPIKKGEEMFINYQGEKNDGIPACMRRRSMGKWMFACNCPACYYPSTTTATMPLPSASKNEAEEPKKEEAQQPSEQTSTDKSDAEDKDANKVTGAENDETNARVSLDSTCGAFTPRDVAAQWLEGLGHGFLCPSSACASHPLITACREFCGTSATTSSSPTSTSTSNTPSPTPSSPSNLASSPLSPSEKGDAKAAAAERRGINSAVHKALGLALHSMLEASVAEERAYSDKCSTTKGTASSAIASAASTTKGKGGKKGNTSTNSNNDSSGNATATTPVTTTTQSSSASTVGPPPLFIPTLAPFGATDVYCCRCGASMKETFHDNTTNNNNNGGGSGGGTTTEGSSGICALPARQAVWAATDKFLSSRREISTAAAASSTTTTRSTRKYVSQYTPFCGPDATDQLVARWADSIIEDAKELTEKLNNSGSSNSVTFADLARRGAVLQGPAALLFDPSVFDAKALKALPPQSTVASFPPLEAIMAAIYSEKDGRSLLRAAPLPLLSPLLCVPPTNAAWLRLTTALELFCAGRSPHLSPQEGTQLVVAQRATLAMARLAAAVVYAADRPYLAAGVGRALLMAKTCAVSADVLAGTAWSPAAVEEALAAVDEGCGEGRTNLRGIRFGSMVERPMDGALSGSTQYADRGLEFEAQSSALNTEALLRKAAGMWGEEGAYDMMRRAM